MFYMFLVKLTELDNEINNRENALFEYLIAHIEWYREKYIVKRIFRKKELGIQRFKNYNKYIIKFILELKHEIKIN